MRRPASTSTSRSDRLAATAETSLRDHPGVQVVYRFARRMMERGYG